MHRLVIIFALILSTAADGQRYRPENLVGRFDGSVRKRHFGFHICMNSASLNLVTKPGYHHPVISISNPPRPAFAIGILASLHLSKNVKLRTTIPMITFQERQLIYKVYDSTKIKKVSVPVDATNLEFPLLIKWRTNRINNFAAYVIGGAYYSIDLATNKDVESGVSGIKLEQQDYCGTIGLGTDFYMPYFKFGIELRYNFGLVDVNIPDNNTFSSPIDKIFTRSWLLSFTFEG